MSWREVTIWEWVCDGCGAERTEQTDRQPEGWAHGMDGLDRCERCMRVTRQSGRSQAE